MRLPRIQIQIRWLMAAMVVLAVLFALPSTSAVTLLAAVVAVLVLLPTGLAPPGHEVEVATARSIRPISPQICTPTHGM
jgi:hypothetical protein